MPLPACVSVLPLDLTALVAEFGRLWAISDARPRPAAAVRAHWTALIDAWIRAVDMPLFIRKHRGDRGTEIIHPSGRRIIPTDNSPAHWAFTLACDGATPTLDEVRGWVASDAIPVAMILRSTEHGGAKYRRCLTRQFNVNTSGWKLAHLAPVGLNAKLSLGAMQMPALEASFRRFLSPANMFVVPLEWSGLAEVESVVRAVAAHDGR